MQIHQLTYFVAVARTRHFTRAAEITGVSQPTLSKQIRVLENALGAPLFVRNRGAIELTSAGEALLPHAQRILIDVASAERTVHEVASLQRGRVRLGATPSLCDGLLPEALTRFHESYPQIDLEVQEAGSRVLTEELAQGRLDIALLIVPLHTNDPDIETTPVLRERLVLASPVDADVPDAMAVAELRDLPFVMFREGYDLRDVTLRACATAGFEPRLAVEGGEMSAVLRFVQAGLGHAVVPSMVLTTRPQLRATELVDPPLERVIALAHRSSEALPLAARAFKADLLEHLPRIGDGDLALV
ncbi:LysR family transcriptional regulator [Aeromicrobium sp. SMF47]|uniref:LysR family transcriptional regulator n=1 Tax=Aeromicrobium yanjiei TaxID=2662028 RepID=A0A5Q2MD15_9ACTN|nr:MULTISPECIES: LysR substrate-binding domain-containing protein [Aeromicrobium]MRJ75054.1 LysR family transcriptional regulator [Aeromicrobium yanjiei]MRK02890.1 LysR family transcriptional regulator [Aeromicrobium sp. S22]QGG40458.1 LysR family transcriptional regulator [Aeromicrobium yanjiei]